jgi:hypothetical protein
LCRVWRSELAQPSRIGENSVYVRFGLHWFSFILGFFPLPPALLVPLLVHSVVVVISLKLWLHPLL